MAYPHGFLRLVVAGPLYGAERFAFGLNLSTEGADGGTIEIPETVPQGVVNAVEAFIGSTVFTTQVSVDQIKLNLIGEDGRYVNKFDTVLHEYAGNRPTGTGGSYLPPQASLVASLETGQRRGLATRGRIFLPGPSLRVANDGLISGTDADGVAVAVQTFINAMNDTVPGYRACVASDVRGGNFRPITHVRVGRAVDTMQSRRRQIREQYTPLRPITA